MGASPNLHHPSMAYTSMSCQITNLSWDSGHAFKQSLNVRTITHNVTSEQLTKHSDFKTSSCDQVTVNSWTYLSSISSTALSHDMPFMSPRTTVLTSVCSKGKPSASHSHIFLPALIPFLWISWKDTPVLQLSWTYYSSTTSPYYCQCLRDSCL